MLYIPLAQLTTYHYTASSNCIRRSARPNGRLLNACCSSTCWRSLGACEVSFSASRKLGLRERRTHLALLRSVLPKLEAAAFDVAGLLYYTRVSSRGGAGRATSGGQ
eukprot:6195407-Pleurochrysis_carterae.AAC.1